MNTLTTSFRQLIGSLRFVWLIYGVTLVMGLLVALPFYNTLLAEDQNSREFLKLLDGFDYTVYSDFMHRSGRSISPLLSVSRWLGVLSIFMSIFFAGGILMLFSAENQRVSMGEFLAACSAYIGRYVHLFGVVLLFVLAGAVIWLVIGVLAGTLLSDTLTERGLFWIGTVFFGLFGLSATLILCIGDYAKILMFRNDEQRAFRAFGQAGRFVLANLARAYGFYILLIGIGTALFGLYFLIDGLIPMRNWPTILLLFIIQQTLIFSRVGLKIWWLGTAYGVYGSLPQPTIARLIATESTGQERTN
ncbi:MAG: hypothetical protein H7319_19155 [Spirosoma sp.]|nr:hypothetical protein [Spirosoma sp.]